MSRRGRPKTKCGECAVCRNSKSKKKCGPTHLAPQSQDGFLSFYSVALRSCIVSRSLSLSLASGQPRLLRRHGDRFLILLNRMRLSCRCTGAAALEQAPQKQHREEVLFLGWPGHEFVLPRLAEIVTGSQHVAGPSKDNPKPNKWSHREWDRHGNPDVEMCDVHLSGSGKVSACCSATPICSVGGQSHPGQIRALCIGGLGHSHKCLPRPRSSTWHSHNVVSPMAPRLSLPSPLAACACQVVQAVPRCSLQALAGVTTAELLRARTAARKAANKRRLQARQASPTAADAPSCTPVPPEETWSQLTATGRHRLKADPDYDGSARNGISKSAGGRQSPVSPERNGINKSAGGRQSPVYFATATPAADRSTQLASFKRAVLEVETASGTVFTRRIYNRRHPPWPVCGCSKCTVARVWNPTNACPNGGVDGHCCYTPPARRRCPRKGMFGELWPSCPFTPGNGKFLDRWSNVVDCGCVAFPPPTPLLIRCDDGVNAKTAAFNRGCTHWILCELLLRCGTRDTGLCKACRSALDEQKVQK